MDMNCPNCGRTVDSGRSVCPYCQSMLRGGDTGVAAVASATAGFSKTWRKDRLANAAFTEDQLVDNRTYFAIIFGVVLWGLLANVLICYLVCNVYQFGFSTAALGIIYLACSIAGVIISRKSNKPIISFLGYNLVVLPFGLLIGNLVAEIGGTNEPVVGEAFLYTLLIAAGMAAAGVAFPKLFSKIGGVLLGVLAGAVLCELVMLLLGKDANAINWIIAGVFALYVGFDVYRAQAFPKTVDNAVDCALDIYMDIANLFIRIILIMIQSKNNDD